MVHLSNKFHSYQTFSNAEGWDYFHMFMGTLGGVVTGLSLPAFNVLFGEMLDTLNASPDGFAKGIADLCISFVIIAVINIFSGFFQVWSVTSDFVFGCLHHAMLMLHSRCIVGHTLGRDRLSDFVKDM